MNLSPNKTLDEKELKNKLGILSTLSKGFNSLYDISFPHKKKSHLLIRSKKIKTLASHTGHKSSKSTIDPGFEESCPVLAQTLRQNKFRLGRVKTQVDSLRNIQFSDYVKKSLRYQQLLNLNQNKKKHLPTLNAKIGQIVKKPTVEAQAKNITFEIQYQKISLIGWKPESRQGHTCIIYKGNAIIIGGHCSHPFSVVQVYSIQKNNWFKQIQTPIARSYHTSILYKNRFIITFGGMGTYDISRKCRGCFNTVSLIDLANFTNRQLKMHNQDKIEARRSHSAVLMSKNMVVFGGMSSKKQFLGDLVYLDLKQLRWYHKQFKTEGKQLTEQLQSGIAKHKAVAIFKERKQLPFYLADYADYEGIYVFGGGFGNGQQNVMLQISFNKYIPVIKKVDYSGIPPSSVEPIMQKYNDLVLIVSGDQKDRQIRLFNPQYHQFILINNSYSKLVGGIGSSISEHDDRYYVFFGLGEDGYIGGLSSFSIEQKIKQKQTLKKKKPKNFQSAQINDWKDFSHNGHSDNSDDEDAL